MLSERISALALGSAARGGVTIRTCHEHRKHPSSGTLVMEDQPSPATRAPASAVALRRRSRTAFVVVLVASGACVAVGLGVTLRRPAFAPAMGPGAASVTAAASPVAITLSSEPGGAAVYLARSGVLLGHTPTTVRVPRRSVAVELLFRFADGEERTVSVLPDRTGDVHAQAARGAGATPRPPE